LDLLRNIFESILTTSWRASWIVGLILSVSWLLRDRISSGLRYVLWMMLFLHMALPFLWIPTSFSLFNWVPESPMYFVGKTVQEPIPNEAQRLGDQQSSSERYLEASETLAPGLDSDSASASHSRDQTQTPKTKPFSWIPMGILFPQPKFLLVKGTTLFSYRSVKRMKVDASGFLSND
jgi:hypothetical protein